MTPKQVLEIVESAAQAKGLLRKEKIVMGDFTALLTISYGYP